MSFKTLNIFLFLGLAILASTAQAFQDEGEKEELNEFDRAWKQLASSEPGSTEAILFFAKRPDETVEYFDEHLVALRLDEDTFSTLLEKLGSEDEEVAEKAFEAFQHLDPRLFMGLEEIMDRVEEEPIRSRMVEVLSGRKFGSMAGQDIQLRAIGGGDGEEMNYNFSSGNGSWWAEARISRLGMGAWVSKPSWTRAIHAIKILEDIGNAESTRLLARMAQGHEEARPTSIAKEIAMRIKLDRKK